MIKNDKPICGVMRHGKNPRQPMKLGGPRHVCGKEPGHDGAHGNWRWLPQAAVAKLAGR